MSYIVFKHNTEFGPRKGLEGPFHFVNGRVLYYDASVGQYWDPLTDFYIENEEVQMLHSQLVDLFNKN